MIGHYTTGLRAGQRGAADKRCRSEVRVAAAPAGLAARRALSVRGRGPQAQIGGQGPSAVHPRGRMTEGAPTRSTAGERPASLAEAVDLGPMPRGRSSGLRSAAIYVAVPLFVTVIAAASGGLSLAGFASYLPTASIDVTYSFLRMGAAYLASLGFALAYGYYAATRRTGERVMIPILDILQSIPILGFFPFALLFFAALTPGSWPGVNIASVFLIFTSMAWNMVFGVYESLKTLPAELKEVSDTFRLRGFLLFRRVLFPATMNRLVYNSVLSWTAGWFFLVEAEIFTTNTSRALPGIGSFLSFAASEHDGQAFVAGIFVLVIVIALLDFAVWRPLGKWAQRFRYDTSPSGEGETGPTSGATSRIRRVAAYVTRGVRTGVTRISSPLVQLAAITVRPVRRSERRLSLVAYLEVGAILVVCWLILIALIVAVYDVFSGPVLPGVWAQIAVAPPRDGRLGDPRDDGLSDLSRHRASPRDGPRAQSQGQPVRDADGRGRRFVPGDGVVPGDHLRAHPVPHRRGCCGPDADDRYDVVPLFQHPFGPPRTPAGPGGGRDLLRRPRLETVHSGGAPGNLPRPHHRFDHGFRRRLEHPHRGGVPQCQQLPVAEPFRGG